MTLLNFSTTEKIMSIPRVIEQSMFLFWSKQVEVFVPPPNKENQEILSHRNLENSEKVYCLIGCSFYFCEFSVSSTAVADFSFHDSRNRSWPEAFALHHAMCRHSRRHLPPPWAGAAFVSPAIGESRVRSGKGDDVLLRRY